MQLVAFASAPLAVAVAVWGVVRHRGRRFTVPYVLLLIGGPLVGASALLAVATAPLSVDAEGWSVLSGLVAGLVLGRAVRVRSAGDEVVLGRPGWIPLPTSVGLAAVLAAGAAPHLDGLLLAVAALEGGLACSLTAGAVVLVRGTWRRHRLRRATTAVHGPG